jgi:hypothetical protein
MDRKELIRRLQESRREIEPGQDVGIGAFRPEDALGVALAYHETYGDGFPLDYVYDPAEIARRNATGELHTVVARTGKGEVVGFAGIFRPAPHPDVYEAGQLNVVRSYRKRQVGTGLTEALFKGVIPRLPISLLCCEALANATFSQQMAMTEGLEPVGLEVECLPPVQEGEPRLSLVLLVKAYGKAACSAHLPDAYRDFCETAYAELGLPRSLSPGAAFSGETQADRFSLPTAGLLRLTVRRCGADLAEAVAGAEAQADGRGAVQVFLDLGDAAAPRAVELLRDRGYFLSGLLPCWFGTDALVLQKVSQEPDWGAIQGCGPKVGAIRDLVREDFERAGKNGRS